MKRLDGRKDLLTDRILERDTLHYVYIFGLLYTCKILTLICAFFQLCSHVKVHGY